MTVARPITRRGGTTAALMVVIAAPLVLTPCPVRADKASAALAKYEKPIDQAIDRALAFLAKAQLKNGAYRSGIAGNTAVTSLSTMAFLAKGYTPGVGPYGQTIDRGIDYVVATQRPNGFLVPGQHSHGPMYSHTISTLMLSEVTGMVNEARQARVDKALALALKLIVSAQKVKKTGRQQGGWRYQPGSGDSDISCTGWALMSLRSARNNGAAIPKKAIDDAVRFVMNCRRPDGGFGYQPGGPSGLARTGTALLCLELCGKHGDEAANRSYCEGENSSTLGRVVGRYK